MGMYSYKKRIVEIERIIKRLDERLNDLHEDIESKRAVMLGIVKKYDKLEEETLAAKDTDISKYTLTLMYRKLLTWHMEVTESANAFDEVNKFHIQKTIAKLEYEYELEKLKELVKGSGDVVTYGDDTILGEGSGGE